MAVKNIVDFHVVPTQNSFELVFNVPDSDTLVPLEERLFDPTTLTITTATAGGGTVLVAGVDYSFSDLNEFATDKAGVDIYQTLNIINATYQGVDLYIQSGTLNQYGDNLLAEDVNDLQAQINAGSGPYIDQEFSFDISASDQTLDISSLSGEADGYRIRARWTGGDGNFKLSIVLPTGYTYGGVAKATIETDWKGEGQGVMVLVKNGTDLEIEKLVDTDGGNFGSQSWKKTIDGSLEFWDADTYNVAISTGSGNIQVTSSDLTPPTFSITPASTIIRNTFLIDDGASPIVSWVVSGGTSAGPTVGWEPFRLADSLSSTAVDREVGFYAKGRWTTAQVKVS